STLLPLFMLLSSTKYTDMVSVGSADPMHSGEVQYITEARMVKGRKQYRVVWARPHLCGRKQSWVYANLLEKCPQAIASFNRWQDYCKQHGECISFATFRSHDAHWLDFCDDGSNTCLITAFRIAARLLKQPLAVSDDDMAAYMESNGISANGGIPAQCMRSFIRFLGTKGFKFSHAVFGNNLLLESSGNPTIDLCATVRRVGEGVYLLTSVTQNIAHCWIVHCDDYLTTLFDSAGAIPLGEFPAVDFIRTIRRISPYKKKRYRKRNRNNEHAMII
ncbi:hypothetical protein H310_15190, partial [Aphanomyces invadans]